MTKALAKDLSHHLSEEAKSRNPSPLKQAFKYFHDPNIISLGGGLPLPENFPFDSISTKSINPPFNGGINKVPTNDDCLEFTVPKHNDDSGLIPLDTSLQYGNTQGPTPLLDFISKHTEMVHNVGYEDWDVICTIGNTQGFDATLRTFCNRGDIILSEEFTFSSSLEAAHGLGLKVVPVKVDLNGIVPEVFEQQLDNWVGPKPKLLYTIPTGQNPTGSTLSSERRKEVYRIASKHDILIVEDEPYYFLQMETYKENSQERSNAKPTHQEFLDSLVPSFLDFDTEGRVVRLDSFSKVIAPGCRIGWVVAQKRFIERFLRQHEVTIQVASGFAQSMVHGLLHQWGQEGYLDWLIGVRKAYTEKRDIALDAMTKYLPKDKVDFIAPEAGMFFWIKSDARKHPEHSELGTKGAEFALYEAGISNGVLIVPGQWFTAEDVTNPPQKELAKDENAIFFRGTYASVPADKLEKAIALFGQMLEKELN